MSEQDSAQRFEEWSVLELMGHVRLGGKVSEESHFGTALGRIDIPQADGSFVTQYFGGSSVYRLTPTTEEIARAVALHNAPQPVHRFELPAPAQQRFGVCQACGQGGVQLVPGTDRCPECQAADDVEAYADDVEAYADSAETRVDDW